MSESTAADSSTDHEPTEIPIPGAVESPTGYDWDSDDPWTFEATVSCDGFTDVLDPAAAVMQECRLAISPQGAAIRAVDPFNIAAVEAARECVDTSTGTIVLGIPVEELVDQAPAYDPDGDRFELRVEFDPDDGATLALYNETGGCEVSAFDPEGLREAPEEFPGPDEYDLTLRRPTPKIRGMLGAIAEADRSGQVVVSATGETLWVRNVDYSDRELQYEWGISASEASEDVYQHYAAGYVADIARSCWAGGEATLQFGDELPLALTVDSCRLLLAPRITPDSDDVVGVDR